MRIGKRLESIASLVDEGSVIIDIGTDHCFLPIYLVEKKIITKAIAVDNKPEPLKSCHKNIERHHLEDNIKVILSDGFNNIRDEYDTIIICGMGGLNIIDILRPDILPNKKTLILEPNNHQKEVREYLMNKHYTITDELLVTDRNFFYQIIKAEYKAEPISYSEDELMFGPIIMQKYGKELKELINYQINTLKQHLSDENCDKINKKIDYYQRILNKLR